MPGDASRRARSASRARRTTTLALVALTVTVVSLGAACVTGDDGRALRPPSADQTTTTVATSLPATTAGVDVGSASADAVSSAPLPEPMVLTSPVLVEDGEFPVDYTCRGDDRSPPLSWTAPPPGTVELAVVVRDVDLDGFVQWVIAGIDPGTGGVAEATPPAGAVEATNDFGRPGWAGPCPTDDTHHYDIRVYALSQPSGVTAGQPGAEAAAAIESAPAVMSAVLSAWAAPTGG
jgi:Raf kinase inhibitor-like YbhB/YbcL family protein